MQEPERTSDALTLDELLALASGDAGPRDAPKENRHTERPAETAERFDQGPDDLLLRLFGGGAVAEPADAPAREQRPAPAAVAERTTPAATLASLFGASGAPAPGEPAARESESSREFDLLAALGAAPAEAAAAAERHVARERDDAVPPAAPFNLAGALGLDEPAPVRDSKPHEESRPVRSRYADLDLLLSKAASDQPRPEVRANPAPQAPAAPAVAQPLAAKPAAPKPAPASPTATINQVVRPSAPSARSVEQAHSDFAARVARKRLPAATAATAPMSAVPPAQPPRERASAKPLACAPAARVSAKPVEPPTPQPARAVTPATPPVPAPSDRPVVPDVQPARAVAPATPPVPAPSTRTGDRARKLMFAGVALVAVAALAGSAALAVALDNGASAVRGDNTLLALVAGGPRQGAHEAAVAEYHYKVKGAGEGMGQAVERAYFNAEGQLDRSSIEVEFTDAAQAEAFVADARVAFADSLLEGRVADTTATLVVAAEGEPVDRAAYAELLRRDTVDFEEVAQ